MMSELIFNHNMFILWLKNGSLQNIVLIAINLIAFIKTKPTNKKQNTHSHQLDRSILFVSVNECVINKSHKI